MSTNQVTQNHPQVGANQGVGANAPSSSTSGDNALLKAMLIQILELNVLSTAAASEGELSVQLRQTMQNYVTEHIEEIQKLMKLGEDCEGGKNWESLWIWFNSSGPGVKTFAALMSIFPDSGLSGVPSDLRGDFVNQVLGLFDSPDPDHVSDFRTKVGTLGTTLQQYGTFQTAAKNLADAYQNGAGSLAQSITQFLAQLATESGLMGDVVGQ